MRYSKLPAVLIAAILLAILPVPALSGGSSEPPPGGGKAPEPLNPVASVRILSPSPSDVVHGPTRIRVEVDPFGDRKVTQVEIFADGVLVARDPLPPFEALWKAGEDLTSRVIRAVAILSDGTQAEDLITTRGLRFHEQELVEATPLEHVQLLVSVTGPDGKPVSGLDAGSFRVQEEGEPITISKVTPLSKRMDLPLSVALLIDRSGSMRVHMAKIARAAVDLLSVLRPVDSVRVACFSDDMHVLQDFTRDPVSLLESLAKVGPAGGGTRLFRAIHDTVRDMRDRPGRKVLVVLTDGLDTEFTSPSSPITVNMYPILTEVARAASRAGVTVVVILPGPTGRGYLAVQDLALQTGGWYAYPGEDFSGTLRRLGERVLGGYVVEFDTKRPEDPDRKRSLEVSLAPGLPKGFEVNAALGTYAGLDLFDALSQDLQDGTPEQRARAASEIELVPGEDAAKALRDALGDKDPGVRAAAVTALGERKDPDGMKDVLDLVHD
ncbi:MAG TPA: VWA domain-containing protein, partial [Candidatus Saccharimonadales bacterium]|nr:VWA domain-containing protein [Candidatus Saccharimonadales bacterium]